MNIKFDVTNYFYYYINMLPNYLNYIKENTDKIIDIKNEIHNVIYLYNNPITNIIDTSIVYHNSYRILYSYSVSTYRYGYIDKKFTPPEYLDLETTIVITAISRSTSCCCSLTSIINYITYEDYENKIKFRKNLLQEIRTHKIIKDMIKTTSLTISKKLNNKFYWI